MYELKYTNITDKFHMKQEALNTGIQRMKDIFWVVGEELRVWEKCNWTARHGVACL